MRGAPPEDVGAALDRLESLDPGIRAFIAEPGRRTRVAAESRRQAASDGPLARVPVAVKDVFRADGLPTRAGSALPAALFAGPESTVVRRVREAGGVILGKTHLDEFGCAEPGPTRNPHDRARTPGGSSAGSAAAVAAGICSVAIGAQTQRSVTAPAAYCGVVGYKPTHGLIPYDGVPLAPSADTIGILTRDMATLTTAAAALTGVVAAPGPAPRLAVPDGYPMELVQPAARRAFTALLTALEEAGAHVVTVPAPWQDDVESWLRTCDDLMLGELAGTHADWYPRYAPRYRPRTAAAIDAGRALPRGRIEAARSRLPVMRRRLAAGLRAAGADCWVCPSALGPAPLGYEHTGDIETTVFWSWAGLPTLSLPAGRAVPADGGPPMPVGLQCVAPHGQDPVLLAVADWLERKLGDTAAIQSGLSHGGAN
ncbi:amidase [Streptomyces daliensis]